MHSINEYCKHVNRHVPLTQYQRDHQFDCPICGNGYLKIARLKVHMNSKHNGIREIENIRVSTAIEEHEANADVTMNELPELNNVDHIEDTFTDTSDSGMYKISMRVFNLDYAYLY